MLGIEGLARIGQVCRKPWSPLSLLLQNQPVEREEGLWKKPDGMRDLLQLPKPSAGFAISSQMEVSGECSWNAGKATCFLEREREEGFAAHQH